MLSLKLSKILAEKNVPHEGGMYWVTLKRVEVKWALEPIITSLEGKL